MTLKEARIKSKLTQKQVAERVGKTERAYQYYEANKKEPKVKIAIAIAKVLGTTVEQIFND